MRPVVVPPVRSPHRHGRTTHGDQALRGVGGRSGAPILPYKWAPFVMAGWVVIGIVVLLVLRARKPEAIDAVAHIHLEEEGV